MSDALYQNRFFRVIRKNGHFVVAENFECNGAVIAARDGDGNYILVDQLRKAIDAISLEFPRGAHDPGEKMSDTALRELLEETGYAANDVEELGVLHTNNSLLGSHVLLFCASNSTQISTETDGEVERVVKMSPKSLLDSVASGKITDSHTLATIAYLLARGLFY